MTPTNPTTPSNNEPLSAKPFPDNSLILNAANKCAENCRLMGKRHKEAVRHGFVNGVDFFKKYASQQTAAKDAEITELKEHIRLAIDFFGNRSDFTGLVHRLRKALATKPNNDK